MEQPVKVLNSLVNSIVLSYSSRRTCASVASSRKKASRRAVSVCVLTNAILFDGTRAAQSRCSPKGLPLTPSCCALRAALMFECGSGCSSGPNCQVEEAQTSAALRCEGWAIQSTPFSLRYRPSRPVCLLLYRSYTCNMRPNGVLVNSFFDALCAPFVEDRSDSLRHPCACQVAVHSGRQQLVVVGQLVEHGCGYGGDQRAGIERLARRRPAGGGVDRNPADLTRRTSGQECADVLDHRPRPISRRPPAFPDFRGAGLGAVVDVLQALLLGLPKCRRLHQDSLAFIAPTRTAEAHHHCFALAVLRRPARQGGSSMSSPYSEHSMSRTTWKTTGLARRRSASACVREAWARGRGSERIARPQRRLLSER